MLSKVRKHSHGISWREMIEHWKVGKTLSYPSYIKKRFFYETSPCDKFMNNKYEDSFIETDYFNDKKQDFSPFKEYIDKSDNNDATHFPDQTKDSILIIPIPRKHKDGRYRNYMTIKDFMDNAPFEQQREFWIYTSRIIITFSRNVPNGLYVNTHGKSIHYFHLRLDKTPKYYIKTEPQQKQELEQKREPVKEPFITQLLYIKENDTYFVAGNISDHKDKFQQLGGKIEYNVSLEIPESVNLITSGYYIKENNFEEISDFFKDRDDEPFFVQYKNQNYGAFGNFLKTKNKMSNMGAKYEKYLLVKGDFKGLRVFTFSKDVDIIKIKDYIKEVNSNSLNYTKYNIDMLLNTGKLPQGIFYKSDKSEKSEKSGKTESESSGSGRKKKEEGLILVENYSDKAFAVFGDTFSHKEKLMKLGGKFNRFLNYNRNKTPGFIFQNNRYDNVKEFVDEVNSSVEFVR